MRGLGFRGLLKPYNLNQESASDGRPVFVVAVWAAGLEKQGFFSEASNGGMQVGRIKGALYIGLLFWDHPPTFIPPWEPIDLYRLCGRV